MPIFAMSVALPILNECERICRGISQNCKHFWRTEQNWYFVKPFTSKWTKSLFEPFRPENRILKYDCSKRTGHMSTSDCVWIIKVTDSFFWSVLELLIFTHKVLSLFLNDTLLNFKTWPLSSERVLSEISLTLKHIKISKGKSGR
jgi:hypothetical protein